MVYLLHSYFGANGREEADEMLARRSGHKDHPRILGAFNKPMRDWLAFFCFTMFTDRDGKYQLAALAESAFDPLARTTRFMLQEEAFHLSVGDTGLTRVVRRTAELMAQGTDPRTVGAIPLDLIQRYINEWASASYDLFGGEDSTNAAAYFATGLKGRYKESDSKLYADHLALDSAYAAQVWQDGRWTTQEIPLRRAMNACLLDAYVEDCQNGLARWNAELEAQHLNERLTLPSVRFNRNVGLYAGSHFDPEGNAVGDPIWQARFGKWLPSDADYEYVKNAMVPVYEPGKIAPWIAPPEKGIGGKRLEFEYVLFH
jgi:benzoyl-CoA 2,3-dioxygenase component B